mgnify:CR=1 FL=1
MLVVSPVISQSSSKTNEKKKNELFPKCTRTKQVAYPCTIYSDVYSINQWTNFVIFSFEFKIFTISTWLSWIETFTRDLNWIGQSVIYMNFAQRLFIEFLFFYREEAHNLFMKEYAAVIKPQPKRAWTSG